ncbi:hypothetical protein EMCRGX_G028925 [Ephydatia muelleri]
MPLSGQVWLRIATRQGAAQRRLALGWRGSQAWTLCGRESSTYDRLMLPIACQCDSTSTHSPSSSYLFRSPHFQTFASSTRLPFQPWSHLTPSVSYLKCRPFHTSSGNWEDKSVIEHAVDQMKEKKKQVELAKEQPLATPVEVKPSLMKRIWEACVHYYHGFKLLMLEIRVSSRLLMKTLKGNSLTRREQKQFHRTAADIFRMVPFSVFIIVPFMELLLPAYLYFFPNALPSTFQTASSKEDRKKKELKMKLQMAKFLQDTMKEMAVESKNPGKNKAVKEFADFIEKIRSTGEQASSDEILRFSKLFENELTLDNLSKPQLLALCKLLLLQPIGNSSFLRFQLRTKLRQLMADDKMIQSEGVDSLTVEELQSACQARGMRAIGMSMDRLRSQLAQWLDLHLATLSALPENIVDEAEVKMAYTSGELAHSKTRLDVIKQQELLIREEAKEREMREKEEKERVEREKERAEKEKEKEKAEEIRDVSAAMEDSVPVVRVSPSAMDDKEEVISVADIRALHEAVSQFKDDTKEILMELIEDREEHVEDVADLAEECKSRELEESKGSVRLGKRVDSMLGKIEATLEKLEGASKNEPDKNTTTITTEELAAVLALKDAYQGSKFRKIVNALDEDLDGSLNLEQVVEVIEDLAMEDSEIKREHLAQLTKLVKKEVTIEEEEEEEEKRKEDEKKKQLSGGASGSQ